MLNAATRADAIKMFRRSVEHWKARLPGQIHEIRYDDLVSDPEPQARALVAAAGLEWEDACLKLKGEVSKAHALERLKDAVARVGVLEPSL